MLNKVDIDTISLDPISVEGLADIFFEIGRSQSKKSKWTEAVHWLERAHHMLPGHIEDLLNSDAGELRISIMHDLSKALLNLGSQSSQEKASSIAHELELYFGDRLVILLLKLDILAIDASYSAQNYCDILQKIVRLVHLNDANVKTILHHVHKLRSRSPLMAHHVLVKLLLERLLGAKETKWIEIALVTIIWNCSNITDFMDVMASLSEVFNALANGATQALSPRATHAAQIVRATHHLHTLC